MSKIAIIIPSRLNALRLPNKPLELINNKEMILHVYEAAKKTNTGDVYVATPDQKIINVITNNGGKAILTSLDHQTGTDRVYEVFKNELKNEHKAVDQVVNNIAEGSINTSLGPIKNVKKRYHYTFNCLFFKLFNSSICRTHRT